MSASSTHAVTRRLTLPHGLAGLQPDGTLWVVMPHPPADLQAAAAPCETCVDLGAVLRIDPPPVGAHEVPCPDCRIELVGECPACDGDGVEVVITGAVHRKCPECRGTSTVTLGYAYPVGGVQEVWRQDVPQRGTSWLLLCHTLGMDAEAVSALVGQYALKLAVTPCSAAT